MKTHEPTFWVHLLGLILLSHVAAAGCRIDRKPSESPYPADAGLDRDLAPEEADEPAAGGESPADRGDGADDHSDDDDDGDDNGDRGDGDESPAAEDDPADTDTDAGDGDGDDDGDGDGSSVDPPDDGNSPEPGCGPDIAVCDPIENTGCPPELGMQCAVDLLAPALAGYCTFSATQAPGTGLACFNSGVTESCPPGETCAGGACRKLCLCDDHCDTGQCCSEPIGAAGFQLCGEC